MNRILSAALLSHVLWLTLAAMPLRSHAIEEPDHQVTRQLDQDVERASTRPMSWPRWS
jgi:hypothetical protein